MQLTIIHIVISCLITYICCKNDKSIKVLMYLGLALIIPVAGYIMCLFIRFTKVDVEKSLSDDEEEIFKNKLLFTNNQVLGDKKNIVSLEEAMLINDSRIKKEQLMRCLQDNDIRNTKVLRLAVKDENVETAHYASVAILDMKSKFEENLRLLNKRYKENKTDIKIIFDYCEELKRYINSGLIEEGKILEYRKNYINILEVLIGFDDKKEYYEEIIDSCLVLKDFKKAESYCNEFMDKYNCEQAYLKRIKYFYELGDKQSFYDNFNKLKNSPITLSREGLKALRFWNDEVSR